MMAPQTIVSTFLPNATTDYTYIRESTDIRVPYNADSIYGINYCAYQVDTKWFFAFVNTITYVNNNLSMAELIQAGNKGLVLAAKNFDESRGFKFICWVVWWVRVSIEMEIEKSNANKKNSPKGKS